MKQYIEAASEFFKRKKTQEGLMELRNLKYGETSKTWKVSDKITIDWEGLIAEPPENDSNWTERELRMVSDETHNLGIGSLDLIKMVDDDPNHVFEKLQKRTHMLSHKEDFKKAWALAEPVVMNLKWKFNRPRPYQLGPLYGIPIKVIETKTHHTPAYPSGHTTYGALMGLILSEFYPEHSPEIFWNIELVARARVSQGVHYPSDNEAAMVLASALWLDIKPLIMENT